MTITVKDTLPVGFRHGDLDVRDFTVRPAVVRDSIEAIEELGADCSKARLRVTIEARQVRFAGVPDDEHSTDLIMALCDKDYGAVTNAIDEAEKKLLARSKP